jgi:hypothetical protein
VACAGEGQVGAKRLAHRVDEAFDAARLEAILPPDVENAHEAVVTLDAGLDPADEAVAEDDRKDVPAPAPLRRRVEELPDVLESEQRSQERAVPDERVERREERDGRRRLRRRVEKSDLVAENEPLAADALDVDRNQLAALDELLAEVRSARMVRPARVRLRRAEAAEDVPAAADAEQAVRAVAREELVAELFAQRARPSSPVKQ